MSKITRSVPLFCLLLALWLLLNDSLSASQWILGAAIALVLSLLAPTLRPVGARFTHPRTALRLVGHVALDVARSNRDVGLRILRGDAARARPALLEIPLHLRDPHGLAALACIVTFTPGTVWAGYDPVRQVLTLHVLDLRDPAALTRVIQERYERPLMEIFQ